MPKSKILSFSGKDYSKRVCGLRFLENGDLDITGSKTSTYLPLHVFITIIILVGMSFHIRKTTPGFLCLRTTPTTDSGVIPYSSKASDREEKLYPTYGDPQPLLHRTGFLPKGQVHRFRGNQQTSPAYRWIQLLRHWDPEGFQDGHREPHQNQRHVWPLTHHFTKTFITF